MNGILKLTASVHRCVRSPVRAEKPTASVPIATNAPSETTPCGWYPKM